MNMTFEIEIKSLLGDKAKADALVVKMQQADLKLKSLGSHKQLNHYFVGGNLKNLYKNAKKILDPAKVDTFARMSEYAKDYSVRTRQADKDVILVVKASVDDTTSSNGTARLEFEAKVNLTLADLDKIVLDSGFTYQAKWSRERLNYKYKDLNVSIDKNAGYGYLAEFESVIGDSSQADRVKAEIRQIMTDLGVAELPQARLARMFDFYNKNWQDYYGTEKVFNIE